MLQFEFPTLERKQDATDFIIEFENANSEVHGSGGLDYHRYEEWLQKVMDYHNGIITNPKYVSASTYFVIDDAKKIVGMVNIRHYLNQDLIETGAGHVGYSVRPTERRKGYATIILNKALQILKQDYNVNEVMVGCYEENIGSKRTIEKNGGVLQDMTIHDEKPSLVYIIDNS